MAEYFPVNDEKAYEAGYIISYVVGSNNEYQLADKAYDSHMVGVTSENPSVVLNNPAVGPPVGMTGRVKVKLVNSKKLIKGGDYLTTSKVSGLAQLATKAGSVIGYAVSNQKEGEDFVEILLMPGVYHNPKH